MTKKVHWEWYWELNQCYGHNWKMVNLPRRKTCDVNKKNPKRTSRKIVLGVT